MPGSPPRSTTDPATSPPPRTRSSSFIPTSMRGSSAAPTSARLRTATATVGCEDRGCVRALSTKVFQAPQSVHCPCHFGLSAPHASQTKVVFAFAIFLTRDARDRSTCSTGLRKRALAHILRAEERASVSYTRRGLVPEL